MILLDATTVLAVVSAVLAVVSLALSLLFYFKTNDINTRFLSMLARLEGISMSAWSQQSDMVKAAWQRLLGQVGSDPDKVSKAVMANVRPQVDALLEQKDKDLDKRLREATTVLSREVTKQLASQLLQSTQKPSTRFHVVDASLFTPTDPSKAFYDGPLPPDFFVTTEPDSQLGKKDK